MAKRKQREPDGAGAGPEGWIRRRLVRWLAEWELDQALGDVADPDVVAEPAVSNAGAGSARSWLATDADAELVAGQIRLFAPEAGATATAWPIYVAILAVTGDAGARLAPFGRFAEPAFPGEWKTGRKDLSLRVLCLWNARLMPAAAARLSWVVDHLRPAELQRALEVLAGTTGPDPWRQPRLPDLGPPLVHPDDPRQVYRYRETARLDALVRELAAHYGSRTGEDLRLAAEPPPEDFPPPKPLQPPA